MQNWKKCSNFNKLECLGHDCLSCFELLNSTELLLKVPPSEELLELKELVKLLGLVKVVIGETSSRSSMMT